MKRKIAVCGNGWSNEYLEIVMSGIRKCAAENNADVFFFLNYSVNDTEAYKHIGDTNINSLLECTEFDGIILLANTFHLQSEFEYLCNFVKEKKIPSVSLEYHLPDIDFLGSDNYSGMYELCNHLVEDHNVKNVMFVSGPKGNAESDSRRKALEDALSKKNLSLKDENILYCNWNYYEVEPKLTAWLKEHPELPDVVVCANDVMAMAACSTLENNGITVPDDVKLTGFDHLLSVRSYYPTIATVDRNWDDMGYQGMQYLLGKIDGKPSVPSKYIDSKAVTGESCGCMNHGNKKRGGRIRENRVYANYVENSFWVGHLCDIADNISLISSEHDFHVSVNEFFHNNHEYEGNEFYICLVENFFQTLKGTALLKKSGYPDRMNVICGLKDGKPKEQIYIETKNLVPGYDEEGESGRVYVFLPLYSIEGSYGYVVFGDELPIIYNYCMYNWVRSVVQGLSRLRQNMIIADLHDQLTRLSVTDGLTGVYNRTGCEKVAYPYLEQCHEQGRNAVLIFADINKMKVINDKYGHLHGDTAISTVANVIHETLGEGWIVVRYGGDEFLMVGEYVDEQQIEEAIQTINKRLEEKVIQMKLPYPLKAGIGYFVVNANEKLDLSECLKKADEAMYLMKKRQHEEMNKEI